MNFNTRQFTEVVEKALTLSSESARWQRAIERAAEGLRSGCIVVTELASGALVTTENASYRVMAGSCECPAYQYKHQPCKHRASRRLIALYNAALVEERLERPVETRTIEYDHCGNRRVVVRYDGWMI